MLVLHEGGLPGSRGLIYATLMVMKRSRVGDAELLVAHQKSVVWGWDDQTHRDNLSQG